MQTTFEQLKNFLVSANRNGYANKEAIKAKPLRPKSEDYHFESGDLSCHDTYFGSRDFIGEEIIYEKGEPVWGVNYCGSILKDATSEKDVYSFLREALLQEDTGSIPVRGPREYSSGNYTYKNSSEGELDRFFGTEEIYFSSDLVYRGFYHGGLIF